MTDIAAGSLRRDIKVVSLIGIAHSFSHFFQLVLPPLFPLLKESFGVSYTELGLVMTLFYAASGLMQTPAGFLVDRFGARAVLMVGLGILAAAVTLFGLVPAFWMFLPLVVLAGFGNSVFHPADYAILTASVGERRLGRAYGVHTLGGNLGWAAAPATMLTLSALLGWRGALIAVGAAGLVIMLLLVWQSGVLADGARQRKARHDGVHGRGHVAVLTAPPVLLSFLYFVLLAITLVGVQTFLPTALLNAFATPLAIGSIALTGFLLGASAGIVVGGILADKTPHHDRIVAVGLGIAAVLLLAAAAGPLPAAALVALVSLAGFASGITTPSRDMLVRGATPRGATGKVFGFVYSGLDLGSALTPLILGLLLDHGAPRGVLVVAAGALVLGGVAAWVLRRASRSQMPEVRSQKPEAKTQVMQAKALDT